MDGTELTILVVVLLIGVIRCLRISLLQMMVGFTKRVVHWLTPKGGPPALPGWQ
jgi:hypothetical protein